MQDPIALALARWRSLRRRLCGERVTGCTVPRFQEVVRLEASFTPPGCIFDTPVRLPTP